MGNAVVVGGGIGGLAAAIALRRAGMEVTVLESAPEIREVGAGISVMANGLAALEVLGVAAEVRRQSRPSPASIRRSDGRWLTRGSTAAAAVGIHRADLQRILLDAVPAGSVITDARVVDVRPGPPAEVTYLRGGEPITLPADLVVGADGLHSTVRSTLWPEVPPPVYIGATAWRAVTRERWNGPMDLGFSWGVGTEFGTVPLVDGRAYWYAAMNAEPGARFPDEMAAVRRLFGSWHDPIPSLLAATDPASVLRNDIGHLATPLPTFVRGRVALLGDAAHAMTPNLGQGAGQAMEDAVVLGIAVGAGPEPAAALAAYDAQRRPRTQRISRLARFTGRVGQELDNRVLVALRNTAMQILPAKLAMGPMLSVTEWRPPVGG